MVERNSFFAAFKAVEEAMVASLMSPSYPRERELVESVTEIRSKWVENFRGSNRNVSNQFIVVIVENL